MEENGPALTGTKWIYPAFGVLTLWALAAGFFVIFSFFPPYDDEGYLMMTVSQTLAGGILYDEVYTQYGPAYYIYRWILSGLFGLPITHDATRFNTLVVWALTALCSGILTFRITRSTLFAAITYVLTFVILWRTVYEPGHPQDISGLLIVMGLLLLTGNESTRRTRFILLAIVVATLCLIKINLGILFGLGLAIAISGSASFRSARILQVVLMLAAAALPFFLFRKYLELGWLRLSIGVAIGVVVAGLIAIRTKAESDEITPRHIALMAVSFLGAAAAIVGVTVAMGSSLSAIMNGVLLQHIKFGDDFYQHAPVQRFAAYVAVLSLALTIVFLLLRRRSPQIEQMISPLLQIGFGLAVAACSLVGYTFFLNQFLLISWATPFLWILLIGETAEAESTRLARLALVFTGILMTLQIFPIAGTQMAYGTFLMAVIGMVCLHDGISRFKAAGYWPAGPQIRLLPAVATTIALVCFCLYWTRENITRYYAQEPLGLPGATLLRLPGEDVELYRHLVTNLKSRCDSFVSMPGFYSLYFWTGKSSPTNLNATAWMSLLDNSQQVAVVDKIKTVQRLCAVYHPQQTRNGASNRNIEQLPLAAYIFENLRTESSLREYQFMVRKSDNIER